MFDALNQAVYSSLRKVDASTKYPSCQAIVLLVDLNISNGDIVTR